MTHADGSFWVYDYDGRYRLTRAERKNSASPTLAALYTYTYDAADNLLTKTEPFLEDFDDGNLLGWTAISGTWSAADGTLASTNGSTCYVYRAQAVDDFRARFKYRRDTVGGNGSVWLRRAGDHEYLELLLRPTSIELRQTSGGQSTTLQANASFPTAEDTWYEVVAECEGDRVRVWYGEVGGDMDLALDYDGAAVVTTGSFWLGGSGTGTYRYDDVEFVGDGWTRTATLSYDAGNKLSTMTVSGVSTSFAYDAAGRLTTLTDYDDSTLSYVYDDAGNVLTLTDYHGNSTYYTYTAGNQVSTITAPGNEVWDFDYTGLGQVSGYTHPNGMTTVYGYDTDGRLTKIEHKDGAAVKESYTYTLDDVGNVSTMTYWSSRK